MASLILALFTQAKEAALLIAVRVPPLHSARTLLAERIHLLRSVVDLDCQRWHSSISFLARLNVQGCAKTQNEQLGQKAQIIILGYTIKYSPIETNNACKPAQLEHIAHLHCHALL